MENNLCWIVYTNDTRFPALQIHEVYTNELAAQTRADQLNKEDRALGVPETVRYTHAQRFLLRDEAATD
jgi:hypothetical protein